MVDIVLASASPRRHELLRGMGVSFESRSAEVDERRRPGERPQDYALRLAVEKASAAANGLRSGLVIGADTIVLLGDDILAKPRDAAEARAHLHRLRGRWHLVATAIAVIDAATGTCRNGIEWTRVRLREYTDDELEAYIASGDPFDKAGAYAIQDPVFGPVAEVEGSVDNVVGLPLGLVSRLLEEAALGERPLQTKNE